jgi:hypothetical protein
LPLADRRKIYWVKMGGLLPSKEAVFFQQMKFNTKVTLLKKVSDLMGVFHFWGEI